MYDNGSAQRKHNGSEQSNESGNEQRTAAGYGQRDHTGDEQRYDSGREPRYVKGNEQRIDTVGEPTGSHPSDDETNETNYSAARYRTPDGAPADIVIFTLTSEERLSTKKSLPFRQLQVMLIQRKRWPFEGQWALPGGFSSESESIHDCARRELQEETGVSGVPIEYLNVYSSPGRDPRGWIISHAFVALVNEASLSERGAADDAADVRLFPLEEALRMELAFDHGDILRDGLERIRTLMLTTTIARQFLPDEFTLGELYQVIQAVVPEFEEKNFIRKITSTQSRKGIIEQVRGEGGTPKTSNRYSQRAAQLYRFSEYKPQLSIYG